MKRAVAGTLVVALLAGCTGRQEPVDRRLVWRAIQPQAVRHGLDPALVYAVVAAESNFDARARNGEARGLMQLSPDAWSMVSSKPYRPGVWEWRTNLAVGIDYLAWCRDQLKAHGHYSAQLLVAAFHYGFRYVESRKFDLRRLPKPQNDIYEQLWRGNLEPVRPPAEES